MGLFGRKNTEDTDLNEMRLSERENAILSLEKQRLDVVRDIEQVMKLISKESRRRSLRKRKYKLGSSPNDFGN